MTTNPDLSKYYKIDDDVDEVTEVYLNHPSMGGSFEDEKNGKCLYVLINKYHETFAMGVYETEKAARQKYYDFLTAFEHGNRMDLISIWSL